MASLLVGSIYGNSILQFDSEGLFQARLIPSIVTGVQLSSPTGIKVGPADGLIYVANRLTNQILRFSADGSVVTILAEGNGISNPQGIVFSPDGTYLYVANSGADNVLQITIAA